MKEITAEQLGDKAAALLDMAQHERVLITRNGKPLAVMVGIRNKDEEDLAWERDASFWETIRERRKDGKTHSLSDVKKMLGLNGKAPDSKRKTAKGRKKA